MKVVKIIAGLLYPADRPDLKDWTRGRLSVLFGEIERESAAYSFDFTDYYHDISPALSRCFFSFKGLRNPEELVDWKRAAIALERESLERECADCRRVNVDPGYLDGARVVLASTKDNAQRIYIRDGIYAEVTICHRKSGWEKFSYTFPDFKSGRYDAFWDIVRADWQKDRKNLESIDSIESCIPIPNQHDKSDFSL